MFYSSVRAMSTKTLSVLLKKPDVKNRVVLNYWSPGYSITESIKVDGKEFSKKKFIPTSTLEAAISFLIKYYGSNQYLKFKKDIHPGHASIQTKHNYLSIGTDELFDVGSTTTHDLIMSDNFETEAQAQGRFPTKRIDFYTLDRITVDKKIQEFTKDPRKVYALFGSRPFGFGPEDGHSCATVSYACLRAGGIENLLLPYSRVISSNTLLTPALLVSYAEVAKAEESAQHPALSKKLSEDFEKINVTSRKEIEEAIRENELEELEILQNEPQDPNRPKR